MTNNDEETPPDRRPEDWSAREKLNAMIEAAGVSGAELGVWLRRKGLKEEHLRQWRTQRLLVATPIPSSGYVPSVTGERNASKKSAAGSQLGIAALMPSV